MLPFAAKNGKPYVLTHARGKNKIKKGILKL
jgi:hypothetical protein